MPFGERQYRFSLRKFKLGLASAIIGLFLIGQAVQADQMIDCPIDPQPIVQGQVQLDYIYVNAEDLTTDQRAALKDARQFSKELADQHKTVILVYEKDQGLLALPNTGDSQVPLLSVLSGLGVLAVYLILDKKRRQSYKVMVILGVSTAMLSGVAGYALETGIQQFLQATHLVSLGEKFPTPQTKIGDRVFTHYLTIDCGPGQTAGADAARNSAQETAKADLPTPAPTVDTDQSVQQQGSGAAGLHEQTEQPSPSSEAVAAPSEKPVVTDNSSEATSELPTLAASETKTVEEPTVVPSQAPVSEGVKSELASSEVKTSEVIVSEAPASEASSTEIVTSEVVISEIEVSEVVTSEVVTSEVEVSEVVTSEVVTSEVVVSEVVTSEVVTSEIVVSEVVTSEVMTSQEVDGEVVTSTELVSEVVTSTSTVSEVVTSTELISEVITSTELVSEVVTSTSQVSEVVTSTSEVSEVTSEISQVSEEVVTSQTVDISEAEPVVVVPEEPAQSQSETITVVEVVVTDVVPFATEMMDDDSLYVGETELVRAGQDGQINRIYQDDVLIAEIVVAEPVSELIKQGTKPVEGKTTETRQESIPFETQVTEDADQYEDFRQETQAGQEGLKEITETFSTEKGVKTEIILETVETILQAPLNQLITQGTKPIFGQETETEAVAMPFTTRYEENPDAYVGDEEVVVVGVDGEKVMTRTYETIKGVRQDNPIISEEVTLAAIEQVIRRGSRPVEGVVDVTTTAPATTDEVRYVDNPDLYEDEFEVLSEAVAGEKVVTTSYKTVRGEQTAEVIAVSEEVTTQPQAKLIARGTKPILGTAEVVTVEDIYTEKVIYVDSVDLYLGDTEVISQSSVGQKAITRTYRTIRGELTDEQIGEPVEDVIVPASPRVIKRGARPIEGTIDLVTATEPVDPDEVIYVDSADLYIGDEELISAAVPGVRTVTTTYKTIRGERTDEIISVTETLTTEPQAKVIAIGTKALEGTIAVVTTEPATTSKVTYVTSADLYVGDEELVSDAVPGVTTVTTLYRTVRGEQTDEVVSVTKRMTTAPKAKVIARGTKPVEGTVDVVTTAPVTTTKVTYVDSADLYVGDEEVVSVAVPGVKTITTTYKTIRGKQTDEVVSVSEKITTAAQPKVVKRGTKPVEGTVDVVTTAPVTTTKVTYVDSADLYVGDEEVVSAAVPGVKTITTTYKTIRGKQTDEVVSVSEKITTAAKPKVVKRGTKPVEGTVNVITTAPVTTTKVTYVDSADLYVGDEEVVSEAVPGVKTITTTYKTIRGKQTDEVVSVSEKITTAAKAKVIAQGTKPIEGTVDVVTIEPITTEKVTYINSPDLYADEEEVVSEAVPGVRTITTTYKTIRGEQTDEVVSVSKKTTTAAKSKVVKRGTKPIEGTVVVVTTEPVNTEKVTYVNSSDLYEGEVELVSEAVPGVKTVTTTYKTVRGERTDEVVSVSEKITTAAQPKVVKRGTKTRKQAELQEPVAIKQTVQVNTVPDAEQSIDQTNLTNVKSITWVEQPSTTKVATNVSGKVRVTYTDNSTDDVSVVIDVVQTKTKPVLTLVTLDEHDKDKAITLNYDLKDNSSSYVSAKFQIYDGDVLVKEQAIDTFDDIQVTDLDWYVPYTLKTTLVYDLGSGQKSEVISEVPFELEYKQVEIKHVDTVELYAKQADGTYQKIDSLANIPSDLSKYYYAKVIDDEQKDIYLAVTAAKETTLNGESVFKLTATAPELIEYSGKGTDNVDDYHFYIPKTTTYNDGKYRSFSELVDAIKANPSGTFELGSDLDASEYTLASGAESYIPGNFSGKLLGNNNAIKGLKAPLFNNLNGGFTVANLGLTEVDINMPNAIKVGALAKTTTGSVGQARITNVAVQGNVVASRLAGGIVYEARNTVMSNLSFDGNIKTTSTSNVNIVGGLIAYVRDASSLLNSKVNANITVNAVNDSDRYHVGAITGSVGESGGSFQTPVRNVVAYGSVVNLANTEGSIGGLIGSSVGTARLNNLVSYVDVTNGKARVGSVSGNYAVPAYNVVVVEGTKAELDSSDQTQTKERAVTQVNNMNITVDLDKFITPDINQYDVDYSKVAGYDAANVLKYANTEKLLPFYNKEYIVKQGNLITSGKLATDEVVSVIPMAGNRIVADYDNNKTAIDKLLVRYADGSIEYLNVSFTEDFRQTGIAEYSISGTDLIYTPNQLTTKYKETVQKVLSELQSIDYYDESVLAATGKAVGDSTVKDLMDQLYLKDSFNQVKDELEDFLNATIATSNIITIGEAKHDLAEYILDNKEELLLGLAYVNRWYNFNFGEISAKDLLLYYQDFYGNKVDTLEWLITLGKSGYNSLNPANNVSTYESQFARYTGYDSLLSYLSANRAALTDYETDNDWFKATTKAYVSETKSEERPDVDVGAFSILSTSREQNGILPLLTARGEIFIITNMGGITYGMYDRYYKDSKVQAAKTQAEKEKIIQDMVDQNAIWQATHFDFWYRNAPENVRDKLIKPMVTWDGYQNPNVGRWMDMYGDDTTNAILDFFGPIGSRAHYKNSGAGAVANGTNIYFMFNQVLTQYGASVFTHEAVHNNDGHVYLGGFGRRFGLGAELFAQGFLQAPTNYNADNFGINTLYDYEEMGYADSDSRYHATSPDRYQTSEDLQEYFHGAFDVLYTLDYAEAEVVLKNLTKEQQAAYFNKIENYYINDPGTGEETHAGNVIRKFTVEEWESLNITSVYDLIDADAVTQRQHAISAGNEVNRANRNGYYYAQLFSPIYSALSNSKGAPGDLMFRRMAYELLAEAGYEDGFIPYASDKLAGLAKERGLTGTQTWNGTRTVGKVTDDLVLETVFNNKYETWADFKKDMFKQRIEKVGSLRPVTITYNDKEVTLASYEDIEALLTEALAEDVRRFLTINANTNINTNNSNYANRSRVKEVKAKIYSAYLKLTDDYRESIYK